MAPQQPPFPNDPIAIFFPNGSVEGVQIFVWQGGKPVLWDGSISVSTTGGPIKDGVDNTILATVLALTNSHPLTVAVVDANGDQVGSFGGGTQYTDGGAPPTHPIGNALVFNSGSAWQYVRSSAGLPVNIVAGNITGFATQTTLASILSVLGSPFQAGGSIGNTAFAITQNKTIKTVSGSFSSDTDVIAAVSSKRLKVFALKIETFGTSATTIIWKSNGTGGTELWRSIVQAITGSKDGETQSTSVPSFLFATVAGEKLTADTNTSDTIHYSMSYWDDDAT